MNHLPPDNLSYPLRIEIGDFQSTGFFIRLNTKVYIVTALHTFYDEEELIDTRFKVIGYTKNINDNLIWTFDVNLQTLIDNNHFYEHDSEDVAALYFADIEEGNLASLKEGINATQVQNDMMSMIPDNSIAQIDDVVISSEVYLLGYPASIGISDLPQIDFERPLVKKGGVAGINYDRKTIILDCAVFHGNSGGPVIQGKYIGIGNYQVSLIGVVTEFVPIEQDIEIEGESDIKGKTTSNSGYSIAVSMDAVKEMIND
jgi:hypothetical protein